MSLVAGHAMLCVDIECLDLLPALESRPIFICHPHLLLQQSGDILGNGEILFGSLAPSPVSSLLGQGDGHVF